MPQCPWSKVVSAFEMAGFPVVVAAVWIPRGGLLKKERDCGHISEAASPFP